MTRCFSAGLVQKTLLFALIMVAVLVAAENANGGARRVNPESYIPKSLDGVAVRTCVVDVSGKSTWGLEILGEAAPDSLRLGFAMMTVSGITGSDDKRWDHVVYGATDRSCTNGGTSMGVMRTQPGISTDVQKELEGLITSRRLQIGRATVVGLDVYLGYLQGKDCIMAFGYPNDSIVLLVFAGKDDGEHAKLAIESMLGAARSSKKRP